MRILLAEDEPNVAGIINKGLTEQGYSVTVALDGKTILSIRRQKMILIKE